MVKLNERFGWEGSFERLERIAGGTASLDQLERVYQRNRAKRARGEAVTWQERLEFGLAALDVRRIPEEAALFLVFRALVDLGPGWERIREVYSARFHDRSEAIRRAHGLAEDEDWLRGEGPPESQALDAEYEAACEEIEQEVFLEYASHSGHPVLKEAAEQCRSDRLAFQRRVERGRQWFYGPPDGQLARHLRPQGIID